MKVISPLTVEEKAHELAGFMRNDDPEFRPRVIVATSGTCNVGIDCANIVGMFRLDMLSSCVDVVQERGRAGRFPDAGNHLCLYKIYLSVSGFEHRLLQIRDPDTIMMDESYRRDLEDELSDCLKLLTISKDCIMQKLDEMMANPEMKIDESQKLICGKCYICKEKMIGKSFS